MVILRPEPVAGHAARLGATLLGRMVPVRGAAAPRIAAAPAWGPLLGDPRAGEAGVGRSRSVVGPDRPRHAQSDWCRRDPEADGIWAPCGRRLRGGGAATPPRPLPPSPNPIGLSPSASPHPPGHAIPALARQSPTTGTPLTRRGPASPPPRPSPQPDSPREYRDLGDSRSRSALSNEMKSEGIAARPSPARGQRVGGSGGGGGTSSPGPRAPNRGRRGEGGCRCLLEGSDFHPSEDRGNGRGMEGKLHRD